MKQENTNNQSVMIEDLPAQGSEEIKGGPKKIFIGGISVHETESQLMDLEPNGNVVGGMLLPAVQKVREAAAATQTGSSGLSAGKVSYSDLH